MGTQCVWLGQARRKCSLQLTCKKNVTCWTKHGLWRWGVPQVIWGCGLPQMLPKGAESFTLNCGDCPVWNHKEEKVLLLVGAFVLNPLVGQTVLGGQVALLKAERRFLLHFGTLLIILSISAFIFPSYLILLHITPTIVSLLNEVTKEPRYRISEVGKDH